MNFDKENFQQFINNSSYKYARSYSLTSNKVNKTFSFPSSLELNPKFVYTAQLDHYSSWHTVVNITERKFEYSFNNGTSWKVITTPKGSWSFSKLFEEIYRQFKANNHYDTVNSKSYIEFVISEQNRIEIKISTNYKIKFPIDKSLSDVIGFNKQTYSVGNHIGQNNPVITSIQKMYIGFSIIQPNIIINEDHAKNKSYIATIPLFTGKIGSKHDVFINNPVKYRIMQSEYDASSVDVLLFDEDGKEIDLSGEDYTLDITILSA